MWFFLAWSEESLQHSYGGEWEWLSWLDNTARVRRHEKHHLPILVLNNMLVIGVVWVFQHSILHGCPRVLQLHVHSRDCSIHATYQMNYLYLSISSKQSADESLILAWSRLLVHQFETTQETPRYLDATKILGAIWCTLLLFFCFFYSLSLIIP